MEDFTDDDVLALADQIGSTLDGTECNLALNALVFLLAGGLAMTDLSKEEAIERVTTQLNVLIDWFQEQPDSIQ